MATVKIHSGLFRSILLFENPVKEQDIAAGNQEVSWQNIVTTKGYLRERDGFRNMETGFDRLIWEYEAYTWWRSELENNLTKDTHITDNTGRVFEIVSYKRMDEDRQFYRFLLIAVQ